VKLQWQVRADQIEAALDQAREAAGDRDVRIAGGAETIVE
jgi:dihydrofolate reductase